jgi:NTE family protein
MDNYRSPRYVAMGLRYSQPVFGGFEWRTEVHAHLNFSQLEDVAQLAMPR